MTTINGVNLGLSGATGTVHFVGSTSPTLVTPTLGAATATSVAFSPTTGGIIGTTVADNAGAGTVGEVISSTILSGSAISLTTVTAANITSISLTAGDWDVWGNGVIGASGTNITACSTWISTTSATAPDSAFQAVLTLSSAEGFAATTYMRVNVSITTTVYLSAIATFGAGTAVANGNIFARRAR